MIAALGSDSYRLLLTGLRLPPRLAEGRMRFRCEGSPGRSSTAGSQRSRSSGNILTTRRCTGSASSSSARATPPSSPRADGKRFLTDAKALQTLLGEHQDTVVAEQLLRSAAARVDSGTAFVAGGLAERRRIRRAKVKKQLPAAWKRLRKSGRRLQYRRRIRVTRAGRTALPSQRTADRLVVRALGGLSSEEDSRLDRIRLCGDGVGSVL